MCQTINISLLKHLSIGKLTFLFSLGFEDLFTKLSYSKHFLRDPGPRTHEVASGISRMTLQKVGIDDITLLRLVPNLMLFRKICPKRPNPMKMSSSTQTWFRQKSVFCNKDNRGQTFQEIMDKLANLE